MRAIVMRVRCDKCHREVEHHDYYGDDLPVGWKRIGPSGDEEDRCPECVPEWCR